MGILFEAIEIELGLQFRLDFVLLSFDFCSLPLKKGELGIPSDAIAHCKM